MSDIPAAGEVVRPRFHQPRQWVRWLAFLSALAGWYVSLELLRVSTDPQTASPFLDAVCGPHQPGQDNDCSSVLTSPQAYVSLGSDGGGAKLPVSALGMAYFAFLAAWYLFIGPPTRGGRYWHVLLVLVVIAGAWESVDYLRIMANELHRWCAGCLVAHAINFLLVGLTVAAYPWRRPVAATAAAAVAQGAPRRAEPGLRPAAALSPPAPGWPHPTGRLVLATVTTGVLLLLVHVLYVYLGITGAVLKSRQEEYAKVLSDPAYVAWDYARQPTVDIPLYPDELFAGDPNAPHTLVTFSDFRCRACLESHKIVREIAQQHAPRLRVVFRYYPQDPACNPDPRYRSGGHGGACLAAQAAEAARVTGGQGAYLAMRQKLWDSQKELPRADDDKERRAAIDTFAEWAAGLGMDRDAFRAAMELPAIQDRIAADIRQAQALDLHAMPVLYLDGKRVRGWSRKETWDALLAPRNSKSASERVGN